MKKEWNKNIIRVGLILSFLAINALVLFGINSVFSYLNTGADRATMLHLESPLEEVYLPKTEWVISNNAGRPMEEQTLLKIQKDYLSAWHVRNQAFMNNNHSALADYFTDSIRKKMYSIIDLNKANGTSIKSTTLEHHPNLDFYSADGKLVVFTDRNVISFDQVLKDQKLVVQKRDTSTYKIMLLLEDGFWRIRHMTAVKEREEPAIQKKKIALSDISEIKESKGINYYPKDSPWAMFGPNFNEGIINKDFAYLHNMGFRPCPSP